MNLKSNSSLIKTPVIIRQIEPTNLTYFPEKHLRELVPELAENINLIAVIKKALDFLGEKYFEDTLPINGAMYSCNNMSFETRLGYLANLKKGGLLRKYNFVQALRLMSELISFEVVSSSNNKKVMIFLGSSKNEELLSCILIYRENREYKFDFIEDITKIVSSIGSYFLS